jgi:drug/metabolite transporter (DMT)-like permease
MAAEANDTHDLPRAAAFMVTSALLFAGMGLMVKVAADSLPNTTIVFARNVFGLLALVPWLLRMGPRGLRTAAWREHAVRGLAGLAAMYCFFYAIAHLRLAEAVLLNYSLPLFTPVIAGVWLHEKVPAGLWRALGLGFVGLVIILRPGLGLFRPAALVGLAAAVLCAVAQVGVRRLTRTEPIIRIVFYFALISTVVSALPLMTLWTTPARGLWPILVALGVLATLGQIFLTRAYAHAPAAQVGPFIYTTVVFAGLLDWLVFGRRALPDAAFVLGALLVCAAGILALRSTTRTTTTAPPAI